MKAREFLRLQRWKYRNGVFWFQQSRPLKEWPTFIVEGKKGEGKTRYLAATGVRYMRAGWKVAANFTIRDRVYGHTSVKIGSWLEVLRMTRDALREGDSVVFIIDEINSWLDARQWGATPAWFRWWFSQSRKMGVGVIGSAQNLKQVEVSGRRLVDELVRIRAMRLGRLPLARIETVDPETVDSDVGYELSEPKLYWHPWWGGYDTQEIVAVEEWKEDAEIMAEVAALSEEIRLMVAPGVISAFCDGDDEQYIAAMEEWSETVSGGLYEGEDS